MKSRKLKAVLAAVSALAVLATAMTGFAATTTIYNADADKVSVSATLPATTGDEVTYLVTTADAGVSGTNIVYIDQQTAKDGQVKFDYKIDKDYITSLSTTVTTGSNGTAVAAEQLTINQAQNNVAGDGYTYSIPVWGNGDSSVTIAIEYAAGKEVDAITVAGEAWTGSTTSIVVPIVDGQLAAWSVTTKDQVVAPGIDTEGTVTAEEAADVADVAEDFTLSGGESFATKYEGKKVYNTIIKVKGTTKPTGVGVYTADASYPAVYNGEEFVVVTLVAADGSEVDAIPYYIVDGVAYNANGIIE